MNNLKLQKDVLAYLQLSTMTAKEKTMWTFMLPSMNDAELGKLYNSLEKEVDALMQLSLEQ